MATNEREESKGLRRVFVIMPFARVSGGERDEARLTSFFENNIKRPIESAEELAYQYYVFRSGESFDITREIIRDLCRADIVIADLSGDAPNPNVMYELGVRLAVSERPVILIKEGRAGAENPFDIIGYYTQPYDPLDYTPLEKHLVEKLARIESGEESFSNPVLDIVRQELGRLTPDLSTIPPERQHELVGHGVAATARVVEGAIGPAGTGIRAELPGGAAAVVRRGHRIAGALHSSSPLEEAGRQLLAKAASATYMDVGDGSKLTVLLAAELVACLSTTAPEQRTSTAESLVQASRKAIDALVQLDCDDTNALEAAGSTAAKGVDLGLSVPEAIREAGDLGEVVIEESYGDPRIVHSDGFHLGSGAVDPDFLTSKEGTADLTDPLVLLYNGHLTSLVELLPILERVVKEERPLLLVAVQISGEALEILRVNLSNLPCLPVAVGGNEGPNAERLDDLAAWTGTKVVRADRGESLSRVAVSDLGSAARVVATLSSVELFEGGGSPERIAQHTAHLRQLAAQADSDYKRERFRDRIAKVNNGLVELFTGGDTDSEQRRRRLGLSEVLSSCMAAAGGGVVHGGGGALSEVASELRRIATEEVGPTPALECLARALDVPRRVLAKTAGADVAELDATPLRVFNVVTHQFEAVSDTSLRDALPVLVSAIRNAVDAAREYLETGNWAGRVDRIDLSG